MDLIHDECCRWQRGEEPARVVALEHVGVTKNQPRQLFPANDEEGTSARVLAPLQVRLGRHPAFPRTGRRVADPRDNLTHLLDLAPPVQTDACACHGYDGSRLGKCPRDGGGGLPCAGGVPEVP